MGKEFTVMMEDGAERSIASMSNDRAQLFCQIAMLLEDYVRMPCGIAPDEGNDERRINSEVFIAFFEKVHAAEWMTEPQGFIHGWASHAAGMIENITLKPRKWICRDGSPLKVLRFLRSDETQSRTEPA